MMKRFVLIALALVAFGCATGKTVSVEQFDALQREMAALKTQQAARDAEAAARAKAAAEAPPVLPSPGERVEGAKREPAPAASTLLQYAGPNTNGLICGVHQGPSIAYVDAEMVPDSLCAGSMCTDIQNNEDDWMSVQKVGGDQTVVCGSHDIIARPVILSETNRQGWVFMAPPHSVVTWLNDVGPSSRLLRFWRPSLKDGGAFREVDRHVMDTITFPAKLFGKRGKRGMTCRAKNC